MSKPDAPEPTDPLGPLALGSAYNNPNQYTPFGNLIYSQPTLPYGTTADNLGNVPLNQIGQGSVELQLPQELQNIYDTQTGITQESLNQAWEALQTLGSTGYNLPGSINIEDYQFGGPTLGAYDEQRDAATQSEFDRQMALIDPVYERREETLRESLASRGIPTARGYGTGATVASDAAIRELDLEADQYRQAVDAAAQQAITQGRQETALGIDYGQALFDQGQQSNINNINLYGTALQQEMGNMGFLQNLVAAPLGYQQVQIPQLNSFYGPVGQDVVGAFGAYDANQQSAYDTQMDLMSSLYGTGAEMAMFFSSKTLKDDMGSGESVLDKLMSVPVRKWRYKGDQYVHIGPYAEDFHAAFGVGSPHMIWIPDLLGVVMSALKELARRREG